MFGVFVVRPLCADDRVETIKQALLRRHYRFVRRFGS